MDTRLPKPRNAWNHKKLGERHGKVSQVRAFTGEVRELQGGRQRPGAAGPMQASASQPFSPTHCQGCRWIGVCDLGQNS